MSRSSATSGITHLSSEDLTKESVVGVFWDYQSCPHPERYTTSAVVRRIHSTALAYGSVRTFNVYRDLEPHPEDTQKASAFADEVLNCLTIPVKTVADRMLLGDILMFTFKHGPGTALVVISADPCLANGLSLLRQRHVNVILISPSTIPNDAATALKSQSDIAFTWEAVLEDEGSSSIDLNGPPSPLDVATSQRKQPACTRPEGEQIAIAQPTKEPTKALSVRSPKPVPTSSLERPSCDLGPSQPADSYDVPKLAPGTSQITEGVIPTHLHTLIDLLAKAARQRGWSLEEIQRRVRSSSPKLAWGNETIASYLEEGVRLGLLTHSIRPETSRRPALHRYAVVKSLKQRMDGPAGSSVHPQAATRTRPEGAQTTIIKPTKEPPTKVLSARSPDTVPTSSLERPSCDLRPSQPADSYDAPKLAPSPSKITEGAIPTHLYALIDLLAKAARQRGWSLGEIQNRVRSSSPKLAWRNETTVSYLEEGVRLGLLTHSIRPGTSRRPALQYYAVTESLKQLMNGRRGSSVHFQAATAIAKLTQEPKTRVLSIRSISTVPTSSLGRRSCDLTQPNSYDGPILLQSTLQITEGVIPKHLDALFRLLAQATRPRGWPLEEIQKRVVGFSSRRARRRERTVSYLEDGEWLGLVTHSILPKTRTRPASHHYAATESLKQLMNGLASSSDVPKLAPKTSQITEADIPKHLYALIYLLAKAARPRGLPLGEIQKRVGSSSKMAWRNGTTVSYLEEGVQLGLLTHSVRPETSTRPARHYYAVMESLKQLMNGPASSSVHPQASTCVLRPCQSIPSISANLAVTPERKLVEEGTSATQPHVPITSTTSGTFEPARKTSTKATSAVPRTPIFDHPKSTVMETIQARMKRLDVSDVPERLRDILDAVVRADKRRGWPQEAIGYHLHRRNIDQWRDPVKVTAALEESVQLGLLEKWTGTSKKNKNVKTYYAVGDGVRKRWLSISRGV